MLIEKVSFDGQENLQLLEEVFSIAEQHFHSKLDEIEKKQMSAKEEEERLSDIHDEISSTLYSIQEYRDKLKEVVE
jgi:gamma-glutamylcyclotransferase (GGCT)/AIG2-like uncharacterized protein YtfP